jgi:HAE1 family hydrophobic/amphiphilic exporter-1
VTFDGEYKETSTTQGSMQRSMVFALIGVFILLSFQFKSYLEPVVVMIAIPCALIGVIWGHIIMGLPLTMPSIMGFISLAGIVVNDSILLVEFIKLRLQEGKPVEVAAAEASRDRFRAILLTSLTTIAGLVPLLFEQSLQAQVLVPLVTQCCVRIAGIDVFNFGIGTCAI